MRNQALNQVCPFADAVAATRMPTRKPTVVGDVGEEHLRRLHALFHTCDADEDGVLTSSELMVLLQLIGASEGDATAAAASASAFSPIDDDVDYASLPPYLVSALLDGAVGSEDGESESKTMTIGASFESFLSDCREVVVRCYESRCALPSRAFVARCRPLKRGFRSCDTDGSLVVTRAELEIALQKLNVILGDDELDRVMALLDCNADGTIEWCEFLFAAWESSRADAGSGNSGQVGSMLQQYFNVEIFTDLPSFIRVKPSPEGSTRGRMMSTVAPTASSVSGSRRNSALAVPASYVSRIEYIGIRLLTRASEARVSNVKRA